MRFFASLRMTGTFESLTVGGVGLLHSRNPTPPHNLNSCHSELNEVERRI